MKTLILARHAKSSWDHLGLDDFLRPLNERGLRDAPVMAERLRQSGLNVQRIVSSDAVRALATAEAYASALTPGKAVRTEPTLYLAATSEIVSIARGLPEQEDSVMLVGHNPGMSDAFSLLSGIDEDMPTCSYGIVQFDTESWRHIADVKGELLAFENPKKSSS